MDKQKLSSLLDEMGTFLDLLGENPFKVRAHQNAARIIETFQGDLEKSIADGSIGEVKGIGPALKEKIEEFYRDGKITEYEKLKAKIAPGLLEMMQIQGLGPKRVRIIHEKLHVSSVGELEYACRENRLLKLDGFGEKMQAKILKNIEYLKKYQSQFLFSEAWTHAQKILEVLGSIKGVKQIEVGGSLRRRKEVVKDIDILVAADSKTAALVSKKFVSHEDVENITGNGDTKSSVVLKNGMACDLRVVTEEQFPYALLYFTGSKEHNTAMRGLAKEKGLKLNEYGLFKTKGRKDDEDPRSGELVKCKTEADIFKALGLDFVPPEMRENLGEIELAQKKKLPVLIEQEQIRGIFHCHTTESDGVNSLEEMVAAAQKRGYEYIGISDHSASAIYAHGLKKDRILDQFKKIEALQKKVKITIFKGVESDILTDGDLDYDDALLKKFDFVIGSIHSRFSQDEDQMTKRVLKAIKNPYLDFVGHPTGRLLLAREPFAIKMNTIIEEAAKQGVVMEINANPQRLDLDWRTGSLLREKKARVSINPDAHSVEGLDDMAFGIGIARKAWLTEDFVINTLPVDKILGSLRGHKARRAK